MERTERSRTDRIERSWARPVAPRSNVVAGSLWMVGITLVLFFLPVINGLIGGLVGGYKVGGVKRGLLAAILPAVVAALGLWLIFGVAGAPGIGFLAAGATLITVVLLSDLGMFVGAAVGGALADSQRRRVVA